MDNFLRDVPVEETPLGAFVDGLRKQKEEKERVLSEGRREDEARRAREKGKRKGDGDVEMLDGDDDDEASASE